jgi:uncharacterized protein YndB with AHSA1/START domain
LNRLVIRWRIHLTSTPDDVHRLLATDEGRARFWAESAAEQGGRVHFRFPGGEDWQGRVLENAAPTAFAVEYLGGTVARFELADDGRGGTDLTLTDTADDRETYAGWISVLLALKAAADFGVDLRNHDAERSWSRGYVDN